MTGEAYGDGHGRYRDLFVGAIALGYAIWLVYAGGLEYVLVAALFYLVGTALFVWAAVGGPQAACSPASRRSLVAVVAVGSVAAVVGLVQGWVSV